MKGIDRSCLPFFLFFDEIVGIVVRIDGLSELLPDSRVVLEVSSRVSPK